MNFLIKMLLFIAFAYQFPAQAEIKSADVTWVANASGGLVTIEGKNGHATGDWVVKDGKGAGIFQVDMRDFKTGIDKRDEHMHQKYLEDDQVKYQNATLEIEPTPLVSNKFDWRGKLTIKGVTKPVSGSATIQNGSFKATFSVSVDDYPIGIPKYLGVTMAKTVDVTVSGKL